MSLLVACGDDSDSASTTSLVTPISTLAASVAPPPASFSEVEADHSAVIETILREGRTVLDQLLGNEFEALHARFDGQMAAQVSVENLRTVVEQLAAQAPLGSRTMERAIPLGLMVRAYGAGLEWGDEVVWAQAAFDSEWRISSLLLRPQTPLANDPAADYESQVSFRLPFEGLWFVFWGGDGELENYHVIAPDQRHALDLVVWKNGGTHDGEGTANEDYWAYGQNVIAPAGGTVVTVVDGLADNAPQMGADPANPAGNHVVIRVADEEYILIAHMQAGSLTVSEENTVEQGQVVGLVGNSGNTSEPHIHIHLQNRPTLDPTATGLPLEFTSYVADGQDVESGELKADQFVANG